MTMISELRALLATLDEDADGLVLALVDDESHREVEAEIDADGDLIITALPWATS